MSLLSIVGDTVRLTAEARVANGNAVLGTAFVWRTSNEQVAGDDSTGNVRAQRQGRGDNCRGVCRNDRKCRRVRRSAQFAPQLRGGRRHVARPAVHGVSMWRTTTILPSPIAYGGLQWCRPNRHRLFSAGWIPQPRAGRDAHQRRNGRVRARRRVLRIEPARWRPPAQGPAGRLSTATEDPTSSFWATATTILRFPVKPHTRFCRQPADTCKPRDWTASSASTTEALPRTWTRTATSTFSLQTVSEARSSCSTMAPARSPWIGRASRESVPMRGYSRPNWSTSTSMSRTPTETATVDVVLNRTGNPAEHVQGILRPAARADDGTQFSRTGRNSCFWTTGDAEVDWIRWLRIFDIDDAGDPAILMAMARSTFSGAPGRHRRSPDGGTSMSRTPTGVSRSLRKQLWRIGRHRRGWGCDVFLSDSPGFPRFLMNDGSGSFSRGADVDDRAGSIRWLHIYDMDGDGEVDLVVDDYQETELFWRNDGGGRFRREPPGA